MTIDIKQSWLMASWDKPKKIKRHIKRYNKKNAGILSIISTAKRFNFTVPQSLGKEIDTKYYFHHKQIMKLRALLNAIEFECINKDNYKDVIWSIFNGSYQWVWKRTKVVEAKKFMKFMIQLQNILQLDKFKELFI